MKTTKKLTLGIFIAMSGLIGAGTACAGISGISLVTNQEMGWMSPECKLVDDRFPNRGELGYKYKCNDEEAFMVRQAKYTMKSKKVYSADGYKTCTYTLVSRLNVMELKWVHSVTSEENQSLCLTYRLSEDNSLWGATINLVPVDLTGGGLPEVPY